MIQEATLIEAILSIRSQIDFLWQFFVTAHIAIFALLFIYDEAVESLNVIARVFALGGIALFEWINGKALANTYMLLDATLDQYRALYGEASRFQPAFFQHFVGQTFDRSPGHGPRHPQHGALSSSFWRCCRANSSRRGGTVGRESPIDAIAQTDVWKSVAELT